MALWRLSNWDFITSAGSSVGGGPAWVVQAGGGFLRLLNNSSGEKYQVNYAFAGGGIGAGVKGKGRVTEAVARFLARIRGASGQLSFPSTPSGGLIFATAFAPPGDLPRNVFTGFFEFASVDAVGIVGAADITFAFFFRPGVRPFLELAASLMPATAIQGQALLMQDIWAVGLFSSVGFGLGFGASVTGNLAITVGSHPI
jgi:hypothetical protein